MHAAGPVFVRRRSQKKLPRPLSCGRDFRESASSSGRQASGPAESAGAGVAGVAGVTDGVAEAGGVVGGVAVGLTVEVEPRVMPPVGGELGPAHPVSSQIATHPSPTAAAHPRPCIPVMASVLHCLSAVDPGTRARPFDVRGRCRC